MIYEAQCKSCEAIFEYVSSIAERDLIPTCACGRAESHRVFSMPHVQMDNDFSKENGGKGRFMPQLARHVKDKSGAETYDQKDPNAFCRSQRDALDKCKSMGLVAEKA